MANGDIASAAGIPVVPSTALVKMGYDEINLTRDQVAQFGVKPGTALPITRGGTGATTAPAAVTNLGIPKWAAEPTGNPATLVQRWGNGRMSTLDPTSNLEVVNLQTMNRSRKELLDIINELRARVDALERPTEH